MMQTPALAAAQVASFIQATQQTLLAVTRCVVLRRSHLA